jgi:aryl-alcohol dehydrogenase-like predicted oxidoreductase
MQTRTLGKSSLVVSTVGLGCNNFGGRLDLAATRAVVHRALDAGITLFDTADTYGERGGSETQLGAVLGARRKDIVLATKFGMEMAPDKKGAKRAYILQAVEDSLKRLNTDWIDLYQLHRPDPTTPIEETLRALDDLVKAGKVRFIGCSNLPAWQVVEAQWTAKTYGLAAFVTCQDEFSLVTRAPERELVPAMTAYGLSLLPFFPLASGLLTGKYRRGVAPAEGTRFAAVGRFRDQYLTPRNFDVVEKLETFCAARGHTLLQLAFGWLLSHPVTGSVIAGATTPDQIDQNIAAAGWTLSQDELAELAKILGAA